MVKKVHVSVLRASIIFCLFLMSIATLQAGLAHEGHEHAEPVVVRAIDFNQDTDIFTFQCSVPEEVRDEPVTWSVRTSNPACTIYDMQSPDGIFEWSPSMLSNPNEMNNPDCQNISIRSDDLIHFACQVVHFPPPNYEQVLLRGDFHLDFRSESERTGQYNDTPNIVVHDTNGLFLDVECIPQTGQEPSQLAWIFHHPTTQLTEHFSDDKRITKTLAQAGIWDISCEVAGQRYHLPVEFFQSGPAYVPTADGCVPGEGCPSNQGPIDDNSSSTITVVKIVVNNDGGTHQVADFPLFVNGQGVTSGVATEFAPGTYNITESNSISYNQSFSGDCDTAGTLVLGSGEFKTCTIINNDVSQNEFVCHSGVKDMPVTCSGTITNDTWNGCRTIICDSKQVLACNKDGFFEMYNQGGGTPSTEVCIGETCIQNNGYAKSTTFPICLENSTTPGNETPPVNSPDNNQTTCYESLAGLPVTCLGGTIISDTYNGCRQIMCADNTSSLQVLACGKPNEGVHQYFEIYKQSVNPNGLKICLGETCIQNNGYAKSTDFPICVETQNTTQPPGNQTQPPGNETPPPDNQTTCYNTLEHFPVTCDGELTQDTFTGCRHLTCENANGSVWVLACEKPDNGLAQYFEMYKQTSSGVTPEVCIGDTCMSSQGYVQSSTYPICIHTTEDTQAPDAPIFLEPVEGQPDVEPAHFNLHVFPMEDGDGDEWIGTTYEIYDGNERVWYAENIKNLHPRNGDGVFENALINSDALLLNHSYTVRARHHSSGSLYPVSEWSNTISFRTRDEYIGEDANWTWTAAEGYKVELVASHVNLPVTLEPAPNIYTHLPYESRPKLYMTHLYGQLGVLLNNGTYVRYADDLLNYAEFGSLPGSGEIGVIGLYADETTGDLFVSMSYWDDSANELRGKVDRFTTNIDGTGFTAQTTIVSNIPVSPAHQAQEITRGPDGKLYLGTGDADRPLTSDDWDTLYGKILRFNDDGSNLEVYAAGFRNPYGHEWRPDTNELFVSNNGEDSDDSLYRVLGGETFGWCQEQCDTTLGAWYVWPQTVVPTALVFDDGSSVLAGDGDLYMVHVGPAYLPGQVERGKRIKRINLDGDSFSSESDFVTYTGDGYGTPLGLVLLDDGLYFSDLFGEQGFTGYGTTQGNIYRVVPGVQTEDSAPENNVLSLSFGAGRWYPQGTHMVWECRGSGGSGQYAYDYIYGDGNGQYNVAAESTYHIYPAPGTYNASCVVHDVQTGEIALLSTSITLGD